jgi:hypothetical protein
MINAQTALGHQLLQVAICKAISQVPADAQNDDLIFEMRPRNRASRGFSIRLTVSETGPPRLRQIPLKLSKLLFAGLLHA